jgi:hypothetical protein
MRISIKLSTDVILMLIKYTGCNWELRTYFGHGFHIPKQEKMSILTCVRKHIICKL